MGTSVPMPLPPLPPRTIEQQQEYEYAMRQQRKVRREGRKIKRKNRHVPIVPGPSSKTDD